MLSSYFSYWAGSRADLLEFLTPSSKELEDLHVSFLKAYESIHIANFFETVPLKMFGLPLYLVYPSPQVLIPQESLHLHAEDLCIMLICLGLLP